MTITFKQESDATPESKEGKSEQDNQMVTSVLLKIQPLQSLLWGNLTIYLFL